MSSAAGCPPGSELLPQTCPPQHEWRAQALKHRATAGQRITQGKQESATMASKRMTHGGGPYLPFRRNQIRAREGRIRRRDVQLELPELANGAPLAGFLSLLKFAIREAAQRVAGFATPGRRAPSGSNRRWTRAGAFWWAAVALRATRRRSRVQDYETSPSDSYH